MPGKIPAISKFKGDNSLSFRQWSLQFEAQLKALDVKNEGTKWRDLLLCCTEASAFATVSNAILADGEISYADLKHELETKYCGAEYKRTLETKLRSLVFKPGVNITTFAFEVKSVVQELYGISDGNVIDSIAQNHVLSQLDSSIQEPAKLLQLTGKCTLESLLELINSKVADNPYNIATAKASFETATTSYSSNDRVDRLEKMVEKLCFRMDEMSKGAEGLNKAEACSNCGANGHDRSRCYKLKTCYHCGMKGHISKHCRKKRENSQAPKNGRVSSSAGRMTAESQINGENGVALKPVPRIMLKLNIGGSDMDILYDPGSMYTMITRRAYDELKIKPPLVPVNRSGIGISGETFRLDGVAYLNIKFLREDGTSYILEYQPVLVSSAISSNILGMDTELNFKGAVRDHFNKLITFVPSSGDQVVIKYWKEKKDTNTAYVHVAKATIIPAESIKMVPSKIINSKKDVFKDAPCVFEPIKESRDGLELSDVFLQRASKVLDLPVLNDSSEDMLLPKGEVLGVINSVEQAQETMFRNSTPTALAVHESTLSEDELSPRFQYLDEVTRSKVVSILTEYQANLKKEPVVSHAHHEIHLKDNVPVSQPARRLPYKQRKEILTQIDELLENDIIEPSTSPYSSPIVTVKKKDGSYRMCVDYRALNAKTVPFTFPIPRIDELLDKLHGGAVFSVLDLKNGYHHIPIKEEDRAKTAFVLPNAKYQWKRMPFGLVGAPYSFAATMTDILKGTEDYVACYFDDILIFSNDIKSHFEHLTHVLNKLASAGMKINQRKCDFVKQEVEFVGHRVSKQGVSPVERKLKDIIDFKEPINTDQLRSFLGLAGFYKKFVENFAMIAEPLYSLLRKRSQFEWTESCQEAFQLIKQRLENVGFLCYPQFEKPFVLATDACDNGLGYVLSQEVNGTLKPLQFGGRVLTQAERRYSVTDKELLAVFYAVKKLEVYLYGAAFMVYTDHKPLTYLNSFKDILNRRYRWIEYLQEMGVKIAYVPGKENIVADYLSRNIREEKPLDALGGYSMYLAKDLFDNDEFAAAQHDDEEMQLIFQYLDGGGKSNLKDILPRHFRPHLRKLSINDKGFLVYKHHSKSLVVLPKIFRLEVLTLCHSEWCSGHFAEFKTHRRVLEKFWWPGLLQDVKDYIKECTICLKIKPQTKKVAKMGKRNFPCKPLDLISIDFLVNLPVSRQGNSILLVVNDVFSKYIQLYPLRDRTAESAAKCLIDYSMRFGIPKAVFSDQDPAFESKMFQSLMQGLGIDKRRTTAYNPRSNGLTEQSNSIVKTYLTAALEQNKLVSNVWDKWLREACYAYNTSVHSTTGFSPAELMFGRRFRVPIDILYGTFENTESNLSLQSYKDNLNLMYDTAREHMNQRQARYAAYHDKNVIDDKLSVGDLVYVYLPRLARVKLIAKWNGPFKIIKASHPVYSIEIPSNKGKLIKTVTRDKLKRAPGSVMNTTVLRVPTDDVTNSQSSDEIFAESDSEEELDAPRYNLRPRRNVVRYNEELISFVTMIS